MDIEIDSEISDLRSVPNDTALGNGDFPSIQNTLDETEVIADSGYWVTPEV